MTENGKAYLVDAKGCQPLPLRTSDAQGKSTWYAECAEKWPPALASGQRGQGGVDRHGRRRDSAVLRDDGRYQWSYRGQPLYRWIGMSSPARAAGWRGRMSGTASNC